MSGNPVAEAAKERHVANLCRQINELKAENEILKKLLNNRSSEHVRILDKWKTRLRNQRAEIRRLLDGQKRRT
jgi:hypothetical protein